MSTNVCLGKAMVFPVVIYGHESCTIKRAECRRIDAFELWCWRRLLRIPWTSRRSNQSILREISPGCSLEELMLKLKLQYFGHLMWRADSFEKTMILGKIEHLRRGQQRMRWLDGITDTMDMGLGELGSWWGTGRPGMLQFMGSQRVGHDWVTELSWTDGGKLLMCFTPHFPYLSSGVWWYLVYFLLKAAVRIKWDDAELLWKSQKLMQMKSNIVDATINRSVPWCLNWPTCKQVADT